MNISVIGGDSRIVELVKILNENGNDVYLYGLEKSEKLKGFCHTSNLDEVMEKSDFIITSIPLSKDGKYLNASYTDEKIIVVDIFKIAKN